MQIFDEIKYVDYKKFIQGLKKIYGATNLKEANVIEAINLSFRKVMRKGAFPNETALFKLLYLRVSELEKK